MVPIFQNQKEKKIVPLISQRMSSEFLNHLAFVAMKTEDKENAEWEAVAGYREDRLHPT